MTLRRSTVVVLIGICAVVSSCSREERAPTEPAPPVQPLIVYSSLHEDTVRSITEAYTEKTGVPMHYMLDSQTTLISKLATKEHLPSGDVLLISGTDQLVAAVDNDVLRPTRIEGPRQHIPANLRDPDDYWFGLITNAVVIVYDRRSVDPANLSGYANLGDEKWQGGLCLLASGHESSFSVVASLIAALGEREAELAVRRWMNNLAAPVFKEETELLKAVQAQRCRVGIVATNAVARFMGTGGAEHVGLYWPSASAGGVPLNLAGIGVTRHAQNPETAGLFIEWLTSVDGQNVLGAIEPGFAANPGGVALPPFDGWVDFDESDIEPSRLGYLQQETTLLNERSRYR